MGGLPKSDVRRIATDLGLGVAAKPDSQDICFVPDGDYAKIVSKVRPDAATDGAIVDQSGRELGRHKGIIHYTVGQRRGLEIGGMAEPLYVVRIDAAQQQVVVGPRSALAVSAARLDECNWLADVAGIDAPLMVKVRSMARPVPAQMVGERLVFVAPEYGVSPGQAAVLYCGDRVVGGGWIGETESAELVAA